jgi:hypothetical protein
MKQTLLMIVSILMLASCNHDDNDSIGRLILNGKNAPTLKATTNDPQKLMTVHEICAYQSGYKAYDGDIINFGIHLQTDSAGSNAGVAVPARTDFRTDTINDRLIMPSICIIENGELGYRWIEGRNAYIQLWNSDGTPGDTVAYVPNDIIITMGDSIIKLWEQGKIAELNKVFTEAYVFIPCTGKQFEEQLKARKPDGYYHHETVHEYE